MSSILSRVQRWPVTAIRRCPVGFMMFWGITGAVSLGRRCSPSHPESTTISCLDSNTNCKCQQFLFLSCPLIALYILMRSHVVSSTMSDWCIGLYDDKHLISRLMKLPYTNNMGFVDQINSVQKSWKATTYSLHETLTIQEMLRRSGGHASRIPRYVQCTQTEVV